MATSRLTSLKFLNLKISHEIRHDVVVGSASPDTLIVFSPSLSEYNHDLEGMESEILVNMLTGPLLASSSWLTVMILSSRTFFWALSSVSSPIFVVSLPEFGLAREAILPFMELTLFE